MSNDTDDIHKHKWNDELSDRETFLIGKIIAQWGALEYEIFVQTLMTFDAPDGEDIVLPKTMNNLQFTEILGLWKERVVDKSEGERGKVLEQQLEQMLKLKDYRDALAHGMWQWSKDDLSKITAIRIRKKEIISTHFTADDLADLYSLLSSINFKIRFPGGFEEFAKMRAEKGFSVSRLGLGLMTGDPFAQEWIESTWETRNDEKKAEPDV